MPFTRVLALAVAGLATILIGIREGRPATILVPGDHDSVQAAANSASAGDVILIQRDASPENVSLTARSDLVFVGKGKPTMTSFTLIGCNRVTILGLQITGSAASGIHVASSFDIVVRAVTVRGVAGDGIEVEGSDRVTIEGCRIEGTSRDGIRVGRAPAPCQDVVVVKNRIGDVALSGIVVAGSRNRLEKNAVTGCGTHGILIEAGTDNDFVRNKLSSLDDDGFRVLGGGSNVFLGNSVKAASRFGYYLDCSGNELTGNKAKGSGVFGLMDAAGGNTLVRNSFGWSWTA
jgi:hypothetical protein